MGFRDFQWDITKVGTIVKYVSKNFVEHNNIAETNNDFEVMKNRLGYGLFSHAVTQEVLDFIRGNPLLFMYFLICVEYKTTPRSLENTSDSVIEYIFRKFDKLSRYDHSDYIQGLTYKFYNNFREDCHWVYSLVVVYS